MPLSTISAEGGSFYLLNVHPTSTWVIPLPLPHTPVLSAPNTSEYIGQLSLLLLSKHHCWWVTEAGVVLERKLFHSASDSCLTCVMYLSSSWILGLDSQGKVCLVNFLLVISFFFLIDCLGLAFKRICKSVGDIPVRHS